MSALSVVTFAKRVAKREQPYLSFKGGSFDTGGVSHADQAETYSHLVQ
jgi:hypothetical protein